MLYKYFDESEFNTERAMRELEKVLRKHYFYAYEWLMNNWQTLDT